MMSSAPGSTPATARTAAKYMCYKKSQDIDRIFPTCLRWYRIGELGFKGCLFFQAFLDRPVFNHLEVNGDVDEEQDVSCL